jgi:hypothetical protein
MITADDDITTCISSTCFQPKLSLITTPLLYAPLPQSSTCTIKSQKGSGDF